MQNSSNELSLPLIISPEDFAKDLESYNTNKNICIVDLSSESNYLAGHIPGAVFLPFQSLVSGLAPAPGKLPSVERLVDVINYLGTTNETHFIVYDDEGGGWAGRFIWTLDVIAHKHYSYIDGGMIAWQSAGLELESGQPNAKPNMGSITQLDIDRSYIVDLETIMREIDENTFVVWDARSPEEYSGSRVNAAKGGHIPGAINVEWTELMDPKRAYRIRSDAKEFLEKRGIDGTKPIITHCQSHHRSGFTFLVGKELGYDIRAYDGSWAEWGNHPDTPVET